MSIETPEELAGMLSAGDFGVAAMLEAPDGSSVAVEGIFQAAYVAADPDTEADLSSTGPRFVGRALDLSAAEEGYVLIVDGVRWDVWDNRPDGTGLSELRLHKG